jgi:hypothetical protein
MNQRSSLYGLMAEFDSPTDILAATRRACEEGYQNLDAYTPFPVDGLPEALGFHYTRVPLIVLIGGFIGCIGGFFMQYYIAVIDYPIQIGGRPLNSWPSFVVITFELTILLAALSAVLGMLALNGLPMPHHPVFNVPRFALASKDRFFLVIESIDPKFDLQKTRTFLSSLTAREVTDVEY